ncbi:MAG: DUF1828 domain-containing protein [Candidatus Latescibacter sp.]|nr:DUF1828 domain-containing protein [Candidatus Latescibacter sp.]
MNYLELLKPQFNNHVTIREKRPGVMQLVAPLYHEDGDMMDIFLQTMNESNIIRISDYGMTLMRLSYSYELDTPNKERIFNRIISENQVNEDNGILFIETKPESLYPAIMQFAQTIGKVLNMRIYKREVVQSLFFEILDEIIDTQLSRFNPHHSFLPIPERDDLEVDYLFDVKPSPIYLFGVKDTAKARLSTICLLQFQLNKLKFKGFIVHEDFESLTKEDRIRITSAADKQFPSLDDFRTNALQVFEREVA